MSYEALIGTLREETQGRLTGEGRVLLLQDTTSLDFSSRQAVDGLGRLERGTGWGLFVHSTLAVSEAGVPLGVVAQRAWGRPDSELGKSAQRHETAFADKESYKWVEGLRERDTGQVWTPGITVCDREAHIYEFFADTLDTQLDFVVRATKGRSFTVDGQELFAAITFAPVMAQRLIQVKRHPDRAARQANVSLRFGSLTVRRPRRATSQHETLTVQAVEVIETQPPPGDQAVHWLLLTSLPVTSLAQADQIVTFYTYRWLIERFHFTLKSGCKLEDSQLRTAAAIKRLLAVYSGAAWHLLWLTYLARQSPDAPCTLALSSAEWQALFAFTNRTQRLPASPPTLHQAVRWIAQLGGFLGRPGDGQPGVKVLWRGWSRLQDIAHTWSIFHPSPDVGNA